MPSLFLTLLGLPALDAEPPPTAADAALGKAIYERSCTACHGADGEGASALRAVNVRARSLRGRWLTRTGDDYLQTVIRDGGTAVGRSPLMPAWGRVMSDEDIGNLTAWLRTMSEIPEVTVEPVFLADADPLGPAEPLGVR